ncbi:MAG: hypothetical protein M3119_02285 [Verrucomicrobiota bacterium]|nr:hypothetical protein [Verrucomicrobiota bacterium]
MTNFRTRVAPGGFLLRFSSRFVCLAILIFAFASAYHRAGDPMDEGMLLVYPELIQHGELPYRDFESVYGPGNWYFLAGVYGLFGTHINVERTVGLAYRLACILAIFVLTRHWGLTVATCCMLLAGAILISSGIEALSWYGAMAFALSAIALLVGGNSVSRCVAAGFLAGIAILFRIDIAPALMLAALPILWNLDWRRRALLSGVAGVTALLPLLAIACFAGLGTVLHNIFFVPVIYSSPAHKIPFSTVEPRLAQFFVVHLLAAMVNIAAAVVAVRREQNKTAALAFLAAALFAAGITHQPYHRLDFVHLLFALFVTIPFLPLSGILLAQTIRPLSRSVAAGLAAACAVFLFVCMYRVRVETLFALRGPFQSARSSLLVEKNGRAFLLQPPAATVAVRELLRELDEISKPGETLFVGPADLRRAPYADTFIYHLMPKLHHASYFLEMNHFSMNAVGSRLTSDLEHADWLVLNSAWDDYFKEENASRVNGPDAPMRVLARNFTLVHEYDTFALYRRTSSR